MILLGHNGSGKTTLLNYLLGFYTEKKQHPFLPDFETLVIRLKSQLGKYSYAPEAAFLDYDLSASDYFKLMASIHGIKKYGKSCPGS